MTDRTDHTGGPPRANRTHRLWHWDVGFGGRSVGQQHWASATQSLGFVVQMPVILLLACVSLNSIYRGMFTPRWEDSGGGSQTSSHVRGQKQKQQCWRGDPQNFWRVKWKNTTIKMKNFGSKSKASQRKKKTARYWLFLTAPPKQDGDKGIVQFVTIKTCLTQKTSNIHQGFFKY